MGGGGDGSGGGGGGGVWKPIRSLAVEVTASGFGTYEISLFMIYVTKLYCKRYS